MSTPANLYPGLNDLSDTLEEIPVEISKYLTLLHEIDAKCTNVLPTLTGSIDKLLNNNTKENINGSKKPTLLEINTLLEELMPSLEEKMHVSSLMAELVNKLDKRLDLAYEVAIRNEEIPSSVRLGLDNHPAMHLHKELVQSLNKPPHSHRNTRSTHNTRNESKKDTQTSSNKKENKSSVQENNKRGGTASTNVTSSSNTTTTSAKRRSNNNNTTNVSTSKQQKTSSKSNSKSTNDSNARTPRVNEYGEPVYCYCNQVAYGEMVGCDGEDCEVEWFHLLCTGLTTLPKGKWYCDTCKAKLRKPK